MEPGGDPGRGGDPGGRGGSPGRPGRRPWAAGEAAAGRPGREAGWLRKVLLERRISPPGGLRGGDHASCAKWSETEPKSSFSRGSRPGPPAGIPAPPEHVDWLHWVRFRVLLRATLLPDGCPVGVRRQIWSRRGGLPPCIVTLSMLQPRMVHRRGLHIRASPRLGGVRCGHATRVNF